MKEQSIVRRAMRVYNREILRGWKYSLPIIFSVILGTILIFYIPPLIIAQLIASDVRITLDNGISFLLLFCMSWLGGELLWRFAFFVMARFEARTLEKLYNETLETLLKKDITFFHDRFAGSITKNVLAYARRFETYFDTITFGVISQVGPAVFGLVVLTVISPILSITLLTILVATVLLVRPLIVKRSSLVKHREDTHAKMSGHISDVISNIASVKAFGAEQRELEVHSANAKHFANAAYASWHYHNTRIDMTVSPLYVLANVLALAIIMQTGIDSTTKASLFLAFNYFMSISRFMWEFNGIYRRLEEALTDAGLYIEYADVPSTVADAPDAKTVSVSSGQVEFRNVDFSHHDVSNENALFKNFSLTISAGSRVGLVGHSGAGKSTLVNLLLRYSNVDGGQITIDNQSIADVTQESLHHSIAYVAQEPMLFHRSLRHNIAYGKPGATDAEIIRAAKSAYAYEFIKDLPHGLDTLVGERGVKLSGGQRQRIAIARAILKDAPILVLDEATSALDSESEKLIQDSLGDLMKNRTSIVIAHRLSTIAKLDRIIVLDKGTIVEDGTHEELLKQKGTYAKLWAHQSGGFIES